MTPPTRRDFLAAGAAAIAWTSSRTLFAGTRANGSKMRFGLVTYQWAKDWDLETLITNCEAAGVRGVELRTTHGHKVERDLNKEQRADVKKRFADSQVTNVGIGSNERFDNPDLAVVKQAVEATKQFVLLSRDVGGSGVKVKPDRFHKDVPREKTIEQIGKALNELGKFGSDHGQQIRLEIHGQCAELPTIAKIMEVATHKNVALCWNCNPQDLKGEGLEHNFNLVKNRLGDTTHIRPVDSDAYPTERFLKLLAGVDYGGWVMLEDGKPPQDPAKALIQQQRLFDAMKERVTAG